jgi:hypothetical protein
MNSKPHRNNSDFQLKYFLAGSCTTPDGAWCLLYGQMIDREQVVNDIEAHTIKRQVKKLKAQKVIDSETSDAIEKLEAQAELIELKNGQYIFDMNAEAARQELATIKKLMAEIEPFRKYAHLSVLEASEASQQEEWLGELKLRAENFLMTQGSIPHDHLNTMRCHPDFKMELVPYIQNIFIQMSKNTGADTLNLLSPVKPLFLENNLAQQEQNQ